MTITSISIEDKLIQAVRSSMPKPLANNRIDDNSDLANELGIDSLGLMTLSVELENAYAVSLAEHVEALMNVKSVSDLQLLINKTIFSQ